MSITIDETMTVRDLVIDHPETRQVLEFLGIDYCCGGGDTLAHAVTAAGHDLGTVASALQAAAERAGESHQNRGRDWSAAGLTELADHIEATHHGYMEAALSRLGDLFTKVLKAHGPRHGDMLTPLRTTFQALRSEIELHLMKEEQILFPRAEAMEVLGDA